MLDRGHPAAYIRSGLGDANLAGQHKAVAEAARQRGWPRPTVYAEDQDDLDDGRAPALARLESAIEVGRHDALLIADPGAVTAAASDLMNLLFRCTRNGVAVGFVLPPATATAQVMAVPPAAAEPAARYVPPFPLRRHEAWGALARARIAALTELFPDWRIWLDERGWHARRRETVFLQICQPGMPAFSVHAKSSTGLAMQLYWQQAADGNAAEGRSAG